VAKVKLLDAATLDKKLGRYDLIGEIAAGGMATVFLARLGGAGGFQRFVAIKRLHPHLAHEDEFVEMFLDEARLAAAIHHPHVVSILEVGTSEHGYYLVMEYVEGDTLARLASRVASTGGLMARPVVMRILLDALAGLHAAHEQTDTSGEPVGLVHRDVSPQNILVGADGCSRITDFGIARASARLTSTRAGQMKGKLAYMAPEQARGESLDRRADLFAMGAIAWELLAGRRLFKGENEVATLARVMSGAIPRLSEVDAGAFPALDAVCARALERDVEARFQSAADMADALERAALSPGGPGVASPREVAAYLQEIIGLEMSEQRDSVRTWLAQSEPSADGTLTIPLDRPSRRGAARPSIPIADVEIEIEPDVPSSINGGSSRPTHPSRVSEPSEPSEGATPSQRRSRSAALLWVALAAALLALGFIAWANQGVRGGAVVQAPEVAASSTPPIAVAGESTVVLPSPAAATVADGVSASPTTSVLAAPAASAALSAHPPAPATPPAKPGRPPPARPPLPPPTTPPSKPVGDDLSNPYR
jgi:serine/threonine-protein kinase